MSDHETALQHRLNCPDPTNVNIINGITKQLVTCRSCKASVLIFKEPPRGGAS